MTVVRVLPAPIHFSPLLTQLEQFNMMETAVSSDSLYNQTSTLNYSQALMMDLTGGHCNLPDSQQLAYSSHGNIPNIILTGAQLRLSLTFVLGVKRLQLCSMPLGDKAPFLSFPCGEMIYR